MFINWGKNVFSQPLPCKKNCCEICNIFFNEYFFIFFYLVVIIFFLIQKKLKIYEDSYFSFLRTKFCQMCPQKVAKLK